MNKEQMRELFDQMGGAEQIAEELRQFGIDTELLFSRMAQLTRQHPNKWVAVFDGEVVGFYKSLTRLLAALTSRGIDPRRAAIQFLEYPQRLRILLAA